MEIDLSKQNLAKVPDDLVKHANLKVLNLSSNRLTSIPTFGMFPSSDSILFMVLMSHTAFSSLVTLLMDHNQLTEFPSRSFSHMQK